jgi:TrwC relaxase
MALARGVSPVDGSVLRVMRGTSTVAAIDLTFSAPKSVSVLFAVADDLLAPAVVDAHEEEVDAALGYLEREACFTRRGHAGAEHVRGGGFVAASYRHRMSRAGDPQSHTHVVVGNLTWAEGRYTALDAHPLYEHKSAAGAVYRAVLRAELCERLPWVTWRPAGRGLFEIDGVPEPVLRHFSQRREEIEERAAHSAQGETVSWAGVIGRPGDFTREWAYTALSRARERTTLHVIAEPTTETQARSRLAPHEPGPTTTQTLDMLHRRLRQTESELLALEQDRLRAALTTAPAPTPLARPPMINRG